MVIINNQNGFSVQTIVPNIGPVSPCQFPFSPLGHPGNDNDVFVMGLSLIAARMPNDKMFRKAGKSQIVGSSVPAGVRFECAAPGMTLSKIPVLEIEIRREKPDSNKSEMKLVISTVEKDGMPHSRAPSLKIDMPDQVKSAEAHAILVRYGLSDGSVRYWALPYCLGSDSYGGSSSIHRIPFYPSTATLELARVKFDPALLNSTEMEPMQRTTELAHIFADGIEKSDSVSIDFDKVLNQDHTPGLSRILKQLYHGVDCCVFRIECPK